MKCAIPVQSLATVCGNPNTRHGELQVLGPLGFRDFGVSGVSGFGRGLGV